MKREDLLRRCNPDAVYGTRRVTVAQGRGVGQKLIELKTMGGLRATFMEDKCLDILDLEYKGVNMAFLSKNGLTALDFPETDSFLQYWQGGFLGTCGIRNSGPNCEIDGEFFPFHGRIGQTPVEQVNICEKDGNIIITGTARETKLFGYRLEMERTITVPIDGAKITVNDQVRNLTCDPEFIFLLYHINFGYPFLDEGLKYELPPGKLSGRTPAAEAALDTLPNFTAPQDGVDEYVFFCMTEEEEPKVRITNPKLQISAEVQYKREQLPVLSTWKCMRSGDYALGVEPCTHFIRGRAEEIKNGYDVKVPAFGSLDFGFSVNFK